MYKKSVFGSYATRKTTINVSIFTPHLAPKRHRPVFSVKHNVTIPQSDSPKLGIVGVCRCNSVGFLLFALTVVQFVSNFNRVISHIAPL